MDTVLIHEAMYGIFKRQIVITLILITVCLIAMIKGVICFKATYETSKRKALGIVCIPMICFVIIGLLRGNTLYSCYSDYNEKSYIVLNDTECYIKYGNIGVLESVHTLLIEYEGTSYSLKIQEKKNSLFDSGKYYGSITFAEHSRYVLDYNLVRIEDGSRRQEKTDGRQGDDSVS